MVNTEEERERRRKKCEHWPSLSLSTASRVSPRLTLSFVGGETLALLEQGPEADEGEAAEGDTQNRGSKMLHEREGDFEWARLRAFADLDLRAGREMRTSLLPIDEEGEVERDEGDESDVVGTAGGSVACQPSSVSSSERRLNSSSSRWVLSIRTDTEPKPRNYAQRHCIHESRER